MKDRCENPASKSWSSYGGRGIRVCDEWRGDFVAFLRYVGSRPSSRHSLDRINNEGHYEPGNVRWATSQEQGSNTRRNRNLTFRGETRTFSEWADALGIKRSTLYMRLRAGLTVEEALTKPVEQRWKARGQTS
jgi:hypothetical protein